MSKAFDPYHIWLGIPPDQQPPNHYRLLGVEELEQDPNVIEHAADQRMAHLRGFQSGKNGKLSQQILSEISKAKICLLDPSQKKKYDEDLHRTKVASQVIPVNESVPTPSQIKPSPASLPPTTPAPLQIRATRNRQNTAWWKEPAVLAIGITGVLALVVIIVIANQLSRRGNNTASKDAMVSNPTRSDRPVPETKVQTKPKIETELKTEFGNESIEQPPSEKTMLPNGWMIGKPVNLGPVVNSTASESHPALSVDGLTLIFASNRADGLGDVDLWMTTRASVDKPWAKPVNLRLANSNTRDFTPTLSVDGLTLFFSSDRPGGIGRFDLWKCARTSVDKPFGEPVNLGPTINTRDIESGPALSADGLTLLFLSNRKGGRGQYALWMSTRASQNKPWGKPLNLRAANSSRRDISPAISADGLTLFFSSDRPGGVGGYDLWMCNRASSDEPFGKPINMGPTVNTSIDEASPTISADGLTLFFHSKRDGGQGLSDIWMVPIKVRSTE